MSRNSADFPYEIVYVDDATQANLYRDFETQQKMISVGPDKWFQTERYKDFAATIYNFEVRPSDVWISTFPRSGTTWISEAIWLICNDFDFESAKKINLDDRFRFIEFHTIPPEEVKDGMYEELAAETSRRFIKTHLPFELMPRKINEVGAKVVYVARNPKDAAVSYFHFQHTKIFGYKKDFPLYADYFMNDLVLSAPHSKHVVSGWNRRNDPNVHFMFYEDMKNNTKTTLEQLAEFLEKSISDENMEKMIEHLNIDNIKSNPAVNFSAREKSFVTQNEEKNWEFIRRGKVGGNPEMTREIEEKFDSLIKKDYESFVRPSDVWISTFPRSGTTWVSEAIWLICNDFDYETTKKINLEERFPFIEFHVIPNEKAMNQAKQFGDPESLKPRNVPVFDQLAAHTTRRFIKTHLPFELMPRKIKEVGAKVVYVARNPKDVAVSYFHFQHSPIFGFNKSFETFVDYFMKDEVLYAPQWKHVQSGWKHKSDGNVHFIFYEDMKNDMKNSLRNLGAFLGKPLNNENLDKLMDHLKIDNVRNNPAVNVSARKDPNMPVPGNFEFIRRGQVGGNPEMTKEIEEKFDVFIDKKFKGFGLNVNNVMEEAQSNKSSEEFPYKFTDLDEELHEIISRDFETQAKMLMIGPERWFNTIHYKDFAAKIYNFEVRPSDIWISTFPRSGTTWVSEAIWLICNNFDYKTAKELSFGQRFRYLELHTSASDEVMKEIEKNGDPNSLNRRHGPIYDFLASQTTQRFIKSHLPFELMPKQLKDVGAKVVYVARNPKDVAVSYFHFHKMPSFGFYKNFPTFAEYLMKGLVMYGPHPEHVLSGWKRRHDPNVHFVFYEDMKNDIESSLRKLGTFLEMPLSDENLKDLINHLEFDNVKKNPAINITSSEDIAKGWEFVRRGKVGGNPEMTKEMEEKFDSWADKKFKVLFTVILNLIMNTSKTFPYEFEELDDDKQRIINKIFPNQPKKLILVGPEKWFLTEIYRDFANKIYNFEVRSSDVFICTMPRSGTTWTQEITYLVDLKHIVTSMKTEVEDSEDIYELLENQTTRRFIKTHLPIEFMPRKIKEVGAKVVYVARNPKDVAVSYYHFLGVDSDFRTFAEYFKNDSVIYTPYWKHILGGWNHRNDANVHFLFYKDLKDNFQSSLKNLASFLNKTLSEEELLSLEQHTSFDNMKKNPAINFQMNQETSPNKAFLRRGNVGGNPEVTEEIDDMFEEWTTKNLRGSDLKFLFQN
ncbi:CLUMA_CG017167, isoform A, partial [Clunio marinus]